MTATTTTILMTWAALISLHYGQPHPSDSSTFEGAPTLILDNLQMTLSKRLLLDIESPSRRLLHGYLGWLPQDSSIKYTSCSGEDTTPNTICLKYGNRMRLILRTSDQACTADDENCRATTCHRVQWDHHLTGAMDCFVLGEDSWYGGGERLIQRWPLENDSRPWHAYVTGDPAHCPTGSVLENLWLSSSGFMIFIDRDVPLFLSFNESNNGKLCLATSLTKHPYTSVQVKSQKLAYTVCSSRNVQEAHAFAIRKWLTKPNGLPDERMIREPVWSTWARYKTDIDQDKVLDFAKEIISNNFPFSHLEVDDKWQGCYGDLEFHMDKFPNPKKLVANLKAMGFRVTLWVHPFCNMECKTFDIGKENGFWVKDTQGKPATVKWWDGTGAMLDVTNPAASKWYLSRLQSLKSNYGIDSFKFDAGEISWLDKGFVFNATKDTSEPNLYTKYYVEMASHLGGMVEVRSSWDTQNLPIFVRMYDKDSNWEYTNGLKTLIPTALHFSLMGYRYILPDMVGGNNYGLEGNSLPDKELYIRWLAVNVFLPSIQFSITPWDYDAEVTNIARQMVDLHIKYTNHILKACQQSVRDGTPVIRPLWWHSPDDKIAQNIDSEFLLGDDLLVAPILEKGKTDRDIYIPDGCWLDKLHGNVVEGPIMLRDYQVQLNEIPFFVRRDTSGQMYEFLEPSY